MYNATKQKNIVWIVVIKVATKRAVFFISDGGIC
jgi:hypothetical protein